MHKYEVPKAVIAYIAKYFGFREDTKLPSSSIAKLDSLIDSIVCLETDDRKQGQDVPIANLIEHLG